MMETTTEIRKIKNEEVTELTTTDNGVFDNREWLEKESEYMSDEYRNLDESEPLDFETPDVSDLDIEEVMKQQEAIRKSGKTNMMNMNSVMKIAERSGFDELVKFLKECDPEQYVNMAGYATRYESDEYKVE